MRMRSSGGTAPVAYMSSSHGTGCGPMRAVPTAPEAMRRAIACRLRLRTHIGMACGAVQCSAVQCSAVQCSAVHTPIHSERRSGVQINSPGTGTGTLRTLTSSLRASWHQSAAMQRAVLRVVRRFVWAFSVALGVALRCLVPYRGNGIAHGGASQQLRALDGQWQSHSTATSIGWMR